MNKDLKPLSVKAPLHLLSARGMRAISAVMEHGAIKYAAWNWQDASKNEQRIDELTAALLRHVSSAADPAESDYDEESGLLHMAHAGACAMIILHKLSADYEAGRFKIQSMRKTEEPLVLKATADGVGFERPDEPRCAEHVESQQPPINPS